jgi:hypothetical protein
MSSTAMGTMAGIDVEGRPGAAVLANSITSPKIAPFSGFPSRPPKNNLSHL